MVCYSSLFRHHHGGTFYLNLYNWFYCCVQPKHIKVHMTCMCRHSQTHLGRTDKRKIKTEKHGCLLLQSISLWWRRILEEHTLFISLVDREKISPAGIIDVSMNVSQKQWQHFLHQQRALVCKLQTAGTFILFFNHPCWLPFPHWTSNTQTTHLKAIFETQPCMLKSRGSPCWLPTVVWMKCLCPA